MTALATPEDLELHLQQTLGDWRESAVEKLLEASDQARTEARQHLSRATSTFTLDGTSETDLVLPERPVISVASVLIDGVAVTDYTVRGSILRRRSGWGDRFTVVTVAVTHGFDPIPADLRNVVVRVAGRLFTNPLGKFAENMSGYGATMESQGNIHGPRIFTGDELKVLHAYRLRSVSV